MLRRSPDRTRTLLVALALASATACDPSAAEDAEPAASMPVESARGTPTGEPATGTIGSEGGTVSTPDGRLELQVPEGAFSQPTQVSIQPITNTNPHGVGDAYRLSPEGIAFARPVRVTFAYGAAGAEGRTPAGLGIAFQNAEGVWSAHVRRTVDEETRRVTVTTDHFSDWSLFEMYRLVPEGATLEAGSRQSLGVQSCVREETVTEEGVPLVPLVPTCAPLADGSRLGNWSANSLPGGNPSVGTLQPDGAGALYTAPGALPASNPVAVSVEVRVPGAAKLLLVSHLRIAGDCPVPVCRYEGASWGEVVLGEGDGPTLEVRDRGEARVTWTFSRMNGREAVYLPEGEVSTTWTNASCTITLSPSTHTFNAASASGALSVDFTADPITYSGSGSSSWDGVQTWDCPPADPFVPAEGEDAILTSWFDGDGVAERGGTVLRGTSKQPGGTSGWEFRAVP